VLTTSAIVLEAAIVRTIHSRLFFNKGNDGMPRHPPDELEEKDEHRASVGMVPRTRGLHRTFPVSPLFPWRFPLCQWRRLDVMNKQCGFLQSRDAPPISQVEPRPKERVTLRIGIRFSISCKRRGTATRSVTSSTSVGAAMGLAKANSVTASFFFSWLRLRPSGAL
jgi:hypothetical protein